MMLTDCKVYRLFINGLLRLSAVPVLSRVWTIPMHWNNSCSGAWCCTDKREMTFEHDTLVSSDSSPVESLNGDILH